MDLSHDFHVHSIAALRKGVGIIRYCLESALGMPCVTLLFVNITPSVYGAAGSDLVSQCAFMGSVL